MMTVSQIPRKYHERNWLVCACDFVSFLPEQVFLLTNTDTAYIGLIIVRLWRLKKVYDCISELEEHPACFDWVRLVKLTGAILLNMHVWGCLFYLIASISDEEISWTSGRNDFFKQKFKTRYLTSIYFSMTMYSTVGFGDFHAFTDTEMLTAIINMILNMSLNALVLDQLLDLRKKWRMNKSVSTFIRCYFHQC